MRKPIFLLNCFFTAACFYMPVTTSAAAPIIPPAPTINATSYLLIDAQSQKVLVEHNSHERKPPASLTKIMTAYLAEQELSSGRIAAEDEVLVSVNAWRTGGSKMFIREGTRVAVGNLLKGIIIQSGNDASIALAEHIAGSESAFADMMNQQAAVLGLTNSNFVNATGLPANDHYSSAWDLAMLTKDLIKNHPEHYALYSEKSYTFNNIEQPNRNKLLWRDKTVDGVKTGFTNAAGYCLVSSAVRDGMRLISVVMGTSSDQARMRESQKLLSYGFRYYETQSLYAADVALKEQEIHYGEKESLSLGVSEEVVVSFPRGYYKDIEVEFELPKLLEAPLVVGQEVGGIKLRLGDEIIYEAPLVALEAVAEAGFFGRTADFVYLFFSQLFGSD
ncbi:MAG: D-alanyl-D-alanine carboxypeptidase (penicillin-binding protein 5/6) [Candidatus Azotimanducaceae bacterium]|jgi:D-alanyl-D-alanine carboxypeptidase (penicillin-binding protein 5/6)